jgi:hypothetical protein
MNAIMQHDQPVSAETMEHVLGTGDLSRLSTQQRVEYYGRVCQAIGVNPLTRPFRFMQFQGNTVLYATRDLTDQLRQLRKINVRIVDKQVDGDLYIVTAQASTPDGRQDEDMGAVTLGQLRGEARANALMKCLTKAKRRVTLSICGLGFLDESEVETLHGAYTFDAEAELPPQRQQQASAAREAINAEVPMRAAAAPMQRAPSVAAPRQTFEDPLLEPDGPKWMANLRAALEAATSREEVEEIGAHETVGNAILHAPPAIKRDISALLAQHYARLAEPAADAATGDFPGDMPDLEIAGQEKMAAG